MPEYKVGTIKIASGIGATFLFQTTRLRIASDKAEAPDENGNVAAVQYYNHRAVAEMEAIISRGTAIPCPGQTVAIKGVTLPTVAADGAVTGSFQIDESISTSSTATNFIVDGEPQVIASNRDQTRVSMTVMRYLVNGLPGATTSGGDV